MSINERQIVKKICSSERISRIVVLGDEESGKSSLIKGLIQNNFTQEYTQTLGFNVITVKTTNKIKTPMLVFIDVSGQRCFREVRKACYSGIQLIIAVCDLTRVETLDHLESFWLPEFFQSPSIDQHASINLQLVGNKSDLSSEHSITTKDIHKTALRIKSRYPNVNIILPHLITSAKENSISTNSLHINMESLNLKNYIKL